jgi:hypothetical protein
MNTPVGIAGCRKKCKDRKREESCGRENANTRDALFHIYIQTLRWGIGSHHYYTIWNTMNMHEAKKDRKKWLFGRLGGSG